MRIVEVPVNNIEKIVRWDDIDLFKKRFSILWGNFKGLNIARLEGAFTRERGGLCSGSFNLPEEYRLKSLYVDYRHFYMNDEPININKIMNHLASLTNDIEFKRFIGTKRNKLKSEFIESGWLLYKGKKITTKNVLDIWFNSEIFHNNPAKAVVMEEWKDVFSNETLKSMLFMAVYDSMLVIRDIHWVITEFSKDNLNLRMKVN